MNIFDELEWRGLIYDCTNKEELKKHLESPITLYCGFDPTADCLHLGSLLPIMTLLRFQKFGHNVLPLVGGATGFIGDPTGKSSERNLLTKEILEENVLGIKKVLEKFIKVDNIVNNYDWMKELSVIDYLRDYGKFFNINYMIAKESVKKRMETGLSYTEFSYMLMQAIDFNHLYENYNCTLQIGGQDQWGNITAGFELIRKKHGENKAFALTSPLLLKNDGTKFGKSEGGSLWLDKEKTSPYEIYQFLLNVTDDMVIDLLKFYTFLTKEEIDELSEKVIKEPHLREAQKTLAKEVVTLIHGSDAYLDVERISKALFSGDIKSLNVDEIMSGMKEVPKFEIENNLKLIDLLIEIGAASSKREGREFLTNNAIYLNGEVVNDENLIVNKDLLLEDKLLVLRRGKKKYYLIMIK